MDIEKAIVILKDEDCFWNSPEKDILEAIKHILAEREADKKRIKELEEENHLQRKQIMSAYDKGWILKQKVKDKIEELKKDYEDSKDENGETEYYYPDYTIRKLEELLEDK